MSNISLAPPSPSPESDNQEWLFYSKLMHQRYHPLSYWDASLNCVYANDGFMQIFGLLPTSITGLSLKNILPNIDPHNLQQLDALHLGKELNFIYEITKGQVKVKSVLLHIYPDLNQQQQAEGFFIQALDVSETLLAEPSNVSQQFLKFVHFSPDPLLILNTDGYVELVSKSAEQLLCTTQAQVVQKHIAELLAKDTDIQFIIEEPQPPSPDPRLMEFNVQLNTETTIPVEATICHIPTDKGTKITIQLRDMRPMAARETRMLKNYELMSNQNKKLVNFAHIVSHNLRAHSSNLESLLALLHETEDETERAQIMLFIEQLAVRFKETVNHLNEIVAVEDHKDLHLEPLNIHHYIHKALDTLVMDIRNTQATIDNLVPENCEIPYSAVYMESILLNLMTNTLKYRHPDRVPHVVLTTRLTDDYLVLSIKDNGIGIDLERFGKKLFGMYATFTDNPEATGIGLFITKNQIESLGGKIEVESTLNVGSTFHIYFALQPHVVSL